MTNITPVTTPTILSKGWTWLKSEWHNLLTAVSTSAMAAHFLGLLGKL